MKCPAVTIVSLHRGNQHMKISECYLLNQEEDDTFSTDKAKNSSQVTVPIVKYGLVINVAACGYT